MKTITLLLYFLVILLNVQAQNAKISFDKGKYEKLHALIKINTDFQEINDAILNCLEDNEIKRDKALEQTPLCLTFDVALMLQIAEDKLDGYFLLHNDSLVTIRDMVDADSSTYNELAHLIIGSQAKHYLKDGSKGFIDSDYLRHDRRRSSTETLRYGIKIEQERLCYLLDDGIQVCLKEYRDFYEKKIVFEKDIPRHRTSYEWRGVYDKETNILRKAGYYLGSQKIGVHNEYNENGELLKQFNFDEPPTKEYNEEGQRIPSSDIAAIKTDRDKFEAFIPGQYVLQDSTFIYIQKGGSRTRMITILTNGCSYWAGQVYAETKTLKRGGNFFNGNNGVTEMYLGVHKEFNKQGELLYEEHPDKSFEIDIEELASIMKDSCEIDITDREKVLVTRSVGTEPSYFVRQKNIGGFYVIDGITGQVTRELKRWY